MRRLDHIKKLSDEGGRGWSLDIQCDCGRSGWEKPQVIASQVGWETSLESLRHRLRCSQCGQKGLEVDAVPESRPRGLSKNPR